MIISHEQAAGLINNSLKKIRWAYRRKRLRKEIKGKLEKPYVLTKAEKKEAIEFWSKYTKHFTPLWHELFAQRTGIFDARYIPVDVHFTEIEDKLNDWSSAHGFDNKNNYSMYFPEVRHPKSVFRKLHGVYHDDDFRLITKEQAIQNCIECGDVIFKVATDSGKGGGISFWRSEDGEIELRRMMEELPEDTNAQEYIKQHPMMAKMNPSSCNTIRVMTLVDGTDVKVISAYYQVGVSKEARMGQVSIGGVCVSIKPDGSLYKRAYDEHYHAIEVHPNGMRFEGYRIPSFDKVCETAKMLHQKVGDFLLISWDFTVGEDGEPIFIEMNLNYGGIMYHQLSKGPLFGDQTEEILDKVFKK